MSYEILHNYLPAIKNLNMNQTLTKKELLTDSFLLSEENHIQMYYAPHNEYVNDQAQIVIVGITPGWHQMKTAYEQFVKSFTFSQSLEQALYEAKMTARFAGSMRKNLLHMLDACRIPDVLNIPSTAYLFDQPNTLLHTTSMIKYPVFFNGKNYTGHQPPIEQSALLKHYACHTFPRELSEIEQPALIIPLGKVVDKNITQLIATQSLPKQHYYVSGFPHPSGTNGHRLKQFEQQKEQLRDVIRAWGELLS